MVVTWPTSHASTGWLKAVAEPNIYCAAPAHAHGLWPPPWQLCVRKSSPVPLPIPTRAAAHRHAGDLANVPCFHGLVETTRVAEHFLCRASTSTRLVAASLSSCVCTRAPLCPSQSRHRRRRTAMVETLPTFQAATGWLKTPAEENIPCAATSTFGRFVAASLPSPSQPYLSSNRGAPPCW